MAFFYVIFVICIVNWSRASIQLDNPPLPRASERFRSTAHWVRSPVSNMGQVKLQLFISLWQFWLLLMSLLCVRDEEWLLLSAETERNWTNAHKHGGFPSVIHIFLQSPD